MQLYNFLVGSENAVDETEEYKSKILLKQESFYLLGFVSWLHHFDDLSHWEFRSGNNGFFAVASIVFLIAQMIILFDLGIFNFRYIVLIPSVISMLCLLSV